MKSCPSCYFFHLSGGYEKGTSLLIYSAAWGKKVKTPTIKSKPRQSPVAFAVWGLWLCQPGAGVLCVACEGPPCGPCAALLSVPGWQHEVEQSSKSGTESWACAVPACLELCWNPSQELHCNRTAHTITLCNLQTCIILSKWMIPLPLKLYIWMLEDGGCTSVQSILNQPLFEPVISKGLQYYDRINRRMSLNFEHRYKPHI